MTTRFEEIGTALGRCPKCGAEIPVTAKREIFFPSAPDPLFGGISAGEGVMENESSWIGICQACEIRFQTDDVRDERWESA